jgi:phosphatidylinositol-3-phosphatase
MHRQILLIPLIIILTACALSPLPPTSTPIPPTETPSQTAVPVTETPPSTVTPSPTPAPLVPNFDHIVVIVFENKEFEKVIDNPAMPVFNRLAHDYTLLTQHYAITHPSLPNYISMIGGDTFGIQRNCEDCFINAPSLPDLIETSGRTWRTYQEEMPGPCFIGSGMDYAQKHNPFMYFDSIRLDAGRCQKAVRPLPDLYSDLAADTLPNFVFITPNLCNDAHDCGLDIADGWLNAQMQSLIDFFSTNSQSFLIILTWDEGQSDFSCCSLPEKAGGRVATVLISPQVKNGFEDSTPYTHYSLLKTIAEAWGLPYLGHAADDGNALIVLPWK